MRFILFLICLIFPLTQVNAEDLYVKKKEPPPAEKTAAQLANEYFGNCLKQESATLSKETQELLCACSAAKLSENMTADEMRAMVDNTEEGQTMRNKMLLQVYAPCIEYPTHDLVMKSCIESETPLKQKQKTCQCVASGMAEYIKQNAQFALMTALQENPENLDPLNALMQSPSFDSQSKKVLSACIQGHELGGAR